MNHEPRPEAIEFAEYTTRVEAEASSLRERLAEAEERNTKHLVETSDLIRNFRQEVQGLRAALDRQGRELSDTTTLSQILAGALAVGAPIAYLFGYAKGRANPPSLKERVVSWLFDMV